MKMSETVMKAGDIRKSFFFSGGEQEVLKNLSIDIFLGDFTVIMGNSGSGKSTLLYSLSGLEKIDSGEINYRENKISDYNTSQLAGFRKEHCGFVFQHNYLDDTLSILDNVLLAAFMKKDVKKQVKIKKSKELLEKVGIDKMHFRKYPSQLSGGEQQRVGLARALVNSPDIIFADEPTGALNSQNSARVLDVLSEQNDLGQSIVMVTHDLKSALRGNKIYYLKDGVIVEQLDLGRYHKNEDNQRMEKLQLFLNEMGW